MVGISSLLLGCILGLLTFVDYYHAGILTVLSFYFFRSKKWWGYVGQFLSLWYINIELLGGSTDAVPSKLYTNDGVQIDVKKFYNANVANAQLISQRGQQFKTDADGWVIAIKEETPNESH